MLLYFTASGIRKIHDYTIEALGGISGPLNDGNVEAAVARPMTNVYQNEPFEGLIAKAAAMSYALNKWHGFTDGNKRTALFSLILMLQMNGAYFVNPPYMTKYLLLVAQDECGESDFEKFIRRLSASNRLVSIWKDFRYWRWPNFKWRLVNYLPFASGYSERLELDWLAAGNKRALEMLYEEFDKWESLGFPKGDVEIRISHDIKTAIEEGDIVEQ